MSIIYPLHVSNTVTIHHLWYLLCLFVD